MFGLGKEKELVGLDIGSSSIKAVVLKSKQKNGSVSYKVKKLGYELLPRDAIVEGTIIDASAVAETITLMFDENRIANKNVVISVSGNSVIIKKITLPKMDDQELTETIIWEARHNIPYPYEETNIDYSILRPARRSEDKNLDVLLVAAKKDKITNYLNVVEQSHRHSRAIEVDVFALYNITEINYHDIFWNNTLAIINLGANTINVIVVESGSPQLFRDLPLGGSLITENLSKDLNIGLDEAEKILKGLPVNNIQPAQFQPVLDLSTQTIIEEIRKTFSFYESGKNEETNIEMILLAGGLSKLKDLPQKFEKNLNIKTEILDPFRNITMDEKRFRDTFPEDMAAHFGVAAGLATREPDE